MHHSTKLAVTLAALTLAFASGCGGRDQNTGGGGGGGTGAGGGNGGGGAGAGGGSGGGGADAGMCPTVTVSNAVNNLSQYGGGCVTVVGAVVIGASTPFASTGTGCIGNMMVETFYIQDPSGGPGLGVYKSCKDDTLALPNVGDLVTVSGRLAKFDSSLQISSYAKTMILETLVITGDGGTAVSGAYPPAGMPIEIANGAEYNHDAGNPHPEQIGMALHFSNVTVTERYPAEFIASKADGGTPTPEGFELSNGVWVNDSIVYYDCIRPLAADAGIPLPHGIRGVWDRYNDFYGSTYDPDAGTYTNAPTYAVLTPLTCADLQ